MEINCLRSCKGTQKIISKQINQPKMTKSKEIISQNRTKSKEIISEYALLSSPDFVIASPKIKAHS